MADISGADGLGSPAIEQDPSIAQLQSQQLGVQAAQAVALPATGFVASIDNLSGQIHFTAGANISITNDGITNITISVVGLVKNNITAAAPTSGNDESEGYSVYSLWIDNTIPATPTTYICSDNSTMSAIWTALN
jgi:hypothetical protein